MKMELHIHDNNSHQFGNIEIGDWFEAHSFLWMKVKPTNFGNCIRLTSDTVATIGGYGTIAQDVTVKPVAKVEVTLV